MLPSGVFSPKPDLFSLVVGEQNNDKTTTKTELRSAQTSTFYDNGTSLRTSLVHQNADAMTIEGCFFLWLTNERKIPCFQYGSLKL